LELPGGGKLNPSISAAGDILTNISVLLDRRITIC